MPQLETINGVPPHNFGIARCRSSAADHGITWQHKTGADLSNLKCPIHPSAAIRQTTRGWRNYEWTVIPAAQVAKAAKSKNEAKKKVVADKLTSGEYAIARDLKRGDLVQVDSWRARGAHGLIVSVTPLPKGKVRLEYSRSFESVSKAWDHRLETWRAEQVTPQEYVDATVRLTDIVDVPARQVYRVGGWEAVPNVRRPNWAKEDEAVVWAVHDEQCVALGLTSLIARLERSLKPIDQGGQVGTVLRRNATDEDKERARAQAASRKARWQGELAYAQRRLQEVLGSRTIAFYADYLGVPRAWGVADDRDEAVAEAKRQLEAYRGTTSAQRARFNEDDSYELSVRYLEGSAL